MKTYRDYIIFEANSYYVGDRDTYYTADELEKEGYSWKTNSVTDEHFIVDGSGNIVGGTGITNKKSYDANERKIKKLNNANKIENNLTDINNIIKSNNADLSNNKKKALEYLKTNYPEGLKFYRHVNNAGKVSVQINEPYKGSDRKEILKNILTLMDMPYNDEGTHYYTNEKIEIHIKKNVGYSYKAEDFFPKETKNKQRVYSNSEDFRNDIIDTVSKNSKLAQFRNDVENILGTKDKKKSISESIEALSKCTNSGLMVSFNEVIVPYLILNRNKLTEKDKQNLSKNQNCKKILDAICSINPDETPTKIVYPTTSNNKLVDFMVVFPKKLPAEVIRQDATEEDIETIRKEQEEIIKVSMKNNEGGAINVHQISDIDENEFDEYINTVFKDEIEEVKKSPVYKLYKSLKKNGTPEKGKQTHHLIKSIVESNISKENFENDSEYEEFIKHISNPELEKRKGELGHKKFLTKEENEFLSKYKNLVINIAKKNGFNSEKAFNNYPESIPYIFSGIIIQQCKDDTYSSKLLLYLMGVRDVYQFKTKTSSNGLTAELLKITKDSPTNCKLSNQISSDCYYNAKYGLLGVRFLNLAGIKENYIIENYIISFCDFIKSRMKN